MHNTQGKTDPQTVVYLQQSSQLRVFQFSKEEQFILKFAGY